MRLQKSLSGLLMLVVFGQALAQPQAPAGLTLEELAEFQSLSIDEQAARLQATQEDQGQPQLFDESQPGIAPVIQAIPTPRPVANSPNAEAIEANAQQVQGGDQLAESEEQSDEPEPLQQFGYELFAGVPSTFAPANNIPVPLNYVVGPTDTVIIQFFGQRNFRYEVTVSREGVLDFPEIGPLNVAGLTFQEMRELIQTTVASSLIGQQVSVSMGALRSIQVFVLGEAFRPGSYTVSSLSTMTNALFSSGGVTGVGSLRDIRLMRQGEQVTSLDLYDLLMRGDTSGDVRLQPNDVIFIPTIGTTVGIAGAVRRPAIFELKDETTIADVLPLAGGNLPTAFPAASRIERINERGERTLLDVDLTQQANLTQDVRDGDILQIYSILDQVEGVVLLEGHVNRPGGFAWREGMRVTDILSGVGDMLPNPDLDYALVAREQQPTRTLEILHVNLREALANPGSAADLLLESRDRLIVFGAAQARQARLTDLLNTLRSQETFDQPAPIVTIQGSVRFPGAYPLSDGLALNELIGFAGGLADDAYLDYLLVEREIGNQGRTDVIRLSLEGGFANTASTIDLQAGDNILIFNTYAERAGLLTDVIARLRTQASPTAPARVVQISGDIRYPGEYPLSDGMDVQALIAAAGGLTESAESREAEITRFEVDGTNGRQATHHSISLLSSGAGGLGEGLRVADTVVIRRQPNWSEIETVIVEGEVRSPGSYVIRKNETISQVIERAGGLSPYANPRAAIFLREDLKESEQSLITEFRERLRQAMLAQSMTTTTRAPQPAVSAEMFNELLAQVEATGRLVIDLPEAIENPGGSFDVTLKNNDQLIIPPVNQEITVLGEVQRPTSHLYERDLEVGDYINKSGGLTENANKRGVYVIRASGEVVAYGNSRWFFDSNRSQLEPGDSVVVPFRIRVNDPLYFLTGTSQILFNLATTVLAIDSASD